MFNSYYCWNDIKPQSITISTTIECNIDKLNDRSFGSYFFTSLVSLMKVLIKCSNIWSLLSQNKKNIAYKYEIFNTMQEFHLRDLICLIVFLSQLHRNSLFQKWNKLTHSILIVTTKNAINILDSWCVKCQFQFFFFNVG